MAAARPAGHPDRWAGTAARQARPGNPAHGRCAGLLAGAGRAARQAPAAAGGNEGTRRRPAGIRGAPGFRCGTRRRCRDNIRGCPGHGVVDAVMVPAARAGRAGVLVCPASGARAHLSGHAGGHRHGNGCAGAAATLPAARATQFRLCPARGTCRKIPFGILTHPAAAGPDCPTADTAWQRAEWPPGAWLCRLAVCPLPDVPKICLVFQRGDTLAHIRCHQQAGFPPSTEQPITPSAPAITGLPVHCLLHVFNMFHAKRTSRTVHPAPQTQAISPTRIGHLPHGHPPATRHPEKSRTQGIRHGHGGTANRRLADGLPIPATQRRAAPPQGTTRRVRIYRQ